MWPRIAIVVGLVAGVAVASLVIGGLLLLGPAPVLVATATPTPSVAPSPSLAPSASASATVAPTPSPTPVSSGPPSPGTGSPSPNVATLFHIGQAAPTLAVEKVGGGRFDLASLKGKPVWVNFMGTYCPSCQDELPLMSGFAARYASAGLVVVAVDIREDATTVGEFASALNVTFPVGLDLDGSVASSWGAVALPVHFWIDADGIIRAGSLGGIGPDIMASSLQTILPGVKVTP